MTTLVFVDRDGVLTTPVRDPRSGRYESPYRAENVSLIPGAAGALRTLIDNGGTIIVASNQPAAAKGTCSLEALREVHVRFAALLDAAGVNIAEARYCFHHPDSGHPELGGACSCRKPAPGLLAGADGDQWSDVWMIGDSDVDILAGKAAGARTILIEHPLTAHRRQGDVRPDHRSPSLELASRIVVGRMDTVGEHG